MNKRFSHSDILYILGVLAIPLGLIAFTIYYHLFGADGVVAAKYSGCMFHTMTGFYCPGCGGTRAVVALLHGDILMSFYYHPLVPYSVFVYLLYMVTHTLQRLKIKNIKGLRFHEQFFYVAIAIILLNFIIKNAVQCFWNIELL